MTVNVALVDDHPIVLAGLHAILEPYAARVRLRTANPCEVTKRGIDIVLYDPAASTTGAPFDAQTSSGPDAPKLVVFSWRNEPNRINAAVACGAYGHISKALAPEDLVEAIEQVNRGERVGLQFVGKASPAKGQWPGAEHGLSGRESEVLMWICQGLSNREVSERAYIGINTVKTYIRSAYRKIGAETRPQAVIWALDHGFAPAPEIRDFDPVLTTR